MSAAVVKNIPTPTNPKVAVTTSAWRTNPVFQAFTLLASASPSPRSCSGSTSSSTGSSTGASTWRRRSTTSSPATPTRRCTRRRHRDRRRPRRRPAAAVRRLPRRRLAGRDHRQPAPAGRLYDIALRDFGLLLAALTLPASPPPSSGPEPRPGFFADPLDRLERGTTPVTVYDLARTTSDGASAPVQAAYGSPMEQDRGNNSAPPCAGKYLGQAWTIFAIRRRACASYREGRRRRLRCGLPAVLSSAACDRLRRQPGVRALR